MLYRAVDTMHTTFALLVAQGGIGTVNAYTLNSLNWYTTTASGTLQSVRCVSGTSYIYSLILVLATGPFSPFTPSFPAHSLVVKICFDRLGDLPIGESVNLGSALVNCNRLSGMLQHYLRAIFILDLVRYVIMAMDLYVISNMALSAGFWLCELS